MIDLIRDRGGYTLFLLDEYRTSKICSKCKGEVEYNFMSRKDQRPWKNGNTQKVWGLTRCKAYKTCGKIHGRDVNAVINMYNIVCHMRDHNTTDHPDPFRRILTHDDDDPVATGTTISKRRRYH